MFDAGGDRVILWKTWADSSFRRRRDLEALDKVISANAKLLPIIKRYAKSFGFLVGMAMKELKGKGNPQMINELFKRSCNRTNKTHKSKYD